MLLAEEIRAFLPQLMANYLAVGSIGVRRPRFA